MKFSNTSLSGVLLIDLELREDERGFLARTFCEEESVAKGLNCVGPNAI